MGNKIINMSLLNKDELYNVSKSLASKTRIDIIELLNQNSLNVNEIAEKLNIPTSTAAFNVNILEEAGVINTELQPGARGSMKVCSLRIDNVTIDLGTYNMSPRENSFFINMPIGNFSDCSVHPTCGIVNENGYIDMEDKPRCFYNANRTSAQLIWLYKGYLEYRFQNNIIDGAKVNLIETSMEICSEAPNYRNVWPSDITIWMNDIEIGTWTSPGDMGGRRGKLNPQWWPDSTTQYGLLKTFRVTNAGCFVDEVKISDVTIKQLNLNDQDFIKLRIGIKDNAKNVGGINLFGEKFGDYPQNIVMRLDYII